VAGSGLVVAVRRFVSKVSGILRNSFDADTLPPLVRAGNCAPFFCVMHGLECTDGKKAKYREWLEAVSIKRVLRK